MAQPAAVHPGNALQLVQLSQLIDNIAESAYKGLQGLSQTLPALSDEERYCCVVICWFTMRKFGLLWQSHISTCTQEACFVASSSQHASEATAPSRACRVVQQGKQRHGICLSRQSHSTESNANTHVLQQKFFAASLTSAAHQDHSLAS